MSTQKVRVLWKGHTAKEVKEILEKGCEDTEINLPQEVVWSIESREPPFGSFDLDPGVLVAIITSSTALLASFISLVATIVTSKKAYDQAVLEIQLDDGSKITIPANASRDEIEELLSIAKSLQSAKEIAIAIPRSSQD